MTAEVMFEVPPLPSTASRKVRLFISTGEVSGDLQGALLIKALQRQAQAMAVDLEILALGGDRMAQAGATLLGHTSSIGSIGILEAVPYIWPTMQIQRRAKQYLLKHPPDLIVLIDYAGPNLSFGKYFSQHLPHIPIIYYIAPQEWVWSPLTGSKSQIAGLVDRLLAIFPEEARYYQGQGANVTWVGHPLLDRMQLAPTREQARAALGIPPEQLAVALLPASRHQELKHLLPVMFEAAQRMQAKLPQVHFWIPLSLEVYRQALEQAIQRYGLRATLLAEPTAKTAIPAPADCRPEVSQTLQVIAAADLAITKSGTVNLELALLNVPQVVIYRVSPLTAWIARRLLKFSIPYMSPPNLVEMKSVVPEFLQEQANPDNIVREALELLLNPVRRQQTLMDYEEMRRALGEVGVCDRAAQEVFQLLPKP